MWYTTVWVIVLYVTTHSTVVFSDWSACLCYTANNVSLIPSLSLNSHHLYILPVVSVSVVGWLSVHYIPLSPPSLDLIGELQAQVLLEAICKSFAEGVQIPGRWTLTYDQYTDLHIHRHLTWGPWQLCTSRLCLYGNRPSVVVFRACPLLPFLVG